MDTRKLETYVNDKKLSPDRLAEEVSTDVKKRIVDFVINIASDKLLAYHDVIFYASRNLSKHNIYKFAFSTLFENLEQFNDTDINIYKKRSLEQIADMLTIPTEITRYSGEQRFLKNNIAMLIYYDLLVHQFKSDEVKDAFFKSVGLDELHFLDIIDACIIALRYFVNKFKFKYYKDLFKPSIQLGVINQFAYGDDRDTGTVYEIDGVLPGWKYHLDLPHHFEEPTVLGTTITNESISRMSLKNKD